MHQTPPCCDVHAQGYSRQLHTQQISACIISIDLLYVCTILAISFSAGVVCVSVCLHVCVCVCYTRSEPLSVMPVH